jgi:GNAT superfamily N-acetyltransferase
MEMTIKIRQITKDELYLVEGLDILCFGDSEDQASKEEYLRSIWWIAFDGETPMAYTGAFVDENRYMALQRSGVLPAYRGKGLQKKLIRTRLTYAKRHKITTVYTYASSDNHASVNSLFSQGFKSYTPVWAYAGVHPEDDCIFMYLIKTLTYR